MDIHIDGQNLIVKTDQLNLGRTLDCGQAFRFSKTSEEIWQGVVGKKVLKCSQNGDIITFYDMKKSDFDSSWYDYFDFGLDYNKLLNEFCKDETLKKAIERSSGIRVLKQDKFEMVCSFIFSQNNNIPRIKGIIDRFCENFGEKIDKSFYAFPTLEALNGITVEDLAPLRSGFRAKYIVDAVQKLSSGEVELNSLENLPYEKAKESLMKIKGIGPKVADCVLLFSCRQYEAFPMDVWMKRVMATLYPNGLPKCVGELKGIAQQFLFDYARCIGLD